MSWICPYQRDDYCDKLKKECKPGMKGCVLYKKVKFINPNEKGTQNQIPERCSSSSLNLRGVKCPMNLVKIKLKLEEMQNGQNLEVIIDDGEPIYNVPRAIKEEGHKIVKVEKLNDNGFKLLIRKEAGSNGG